MPGSTRIFALCGIAAVVFYVLGHALAAGLRPDYSMIHHTISALGERGGPYALVFIYMATVPYGLLTALFAVALYRALGTGTAARVGSALVAVGGIATIAAYAVFPRHTSPAPPGAAHLWSGIVMGVAFVVAFFVLASPLRQLGRGYRTYSLGTGAGVLAIWLVAGPLGLFATTPGLGQRLSVAIGLAWTMVIALRILRDLQRTPEAP